VTQSEQQVDVLGSFANVMERLGNMDSAVATAGAAAALATMEVARQAQIRNLIAYASVLADDDPSSVQYEAVLQQIDTALGLNSSTS
jgi:hypothetical protein